MAHPYLWIYIMGIVTCFLVACGNGANDLANAFGTSYGSRVLTLTQIVILATICEFSGAVGLGSNVATTMSGGIADASTFSEDPYVLMYGFLCTLGASFIWLIFATWKNLPVSSHHSVAGGIIGFALVYGGVHSVIWAGKKDTFPYLNGVVPIVISWFVSPVLSGIFSALIYCAARYLFLERENAVRMTPFVLPVIVVITFFLEFMFIFMIAASSRLGWKVGHSVWMAAVVAVAAGVVSIPFAPLLVRRIRSIEVLAEARAFAQGKTVDHVMREVMMGGRPRKQLSVVGGDTSRGSSTDVSEQGATAHHDTHSTNGEKKLEEGVSAVGQVIVHDDDEENAAPDQQERAPFCDGATNDANTNILIPDDADNELDAEGLVRDRDGNLYDITGSRIFNPRAEFLFRYLQVFTAACTSLAHGANDVSNAIGPFSAIYDIYVSQKTASKIVVSTWILVLGGVGIVVGLASYGLNIMRLFGEKITVITPVRGFSAELATALVVSFATVYGLPISTTHCITGAVVAISIVDVGISKVRWGLVLKMYVGWVLTLIITGVMSATFFAQGINSPIKMKM